MSIKDTIGPEKYEALRTSIGKAFPDAKVSDAVVDAVARAAASRPERYQSLGVPSSLAEQRPKLMAAAATSAFPLYNAQATHSRVLVMAPSTAPMRSEFTGVLAQVRVHLPRSLDGGNPKISTPIGDVYLSSDHLVGSIELVAEKIGRTPARVDLVTPARSGGTRFAAIAVYLVYDAEGDATPSSYILEAGTATGDASMIYVSQGMNPILDTTSWYHPTPFSSPNNQYSGWFTMSGDEPSQLIVSSQAAGQTGAYITITVEYDRVPSINAPWPADLTLEAAARVALIAQVMDVPADEPLAGLLAEIGKLLPWAPDGQPHLTGSS